MKRSIIWLAALCIVALAAIAFVWKQSDLGVKGAEIEQDARSKQEIPESWSVAQDVGDSMAALIFYNNDKSDYCISIYATPSEASERFHHRFGGDSSMVGTGIVEYAFDDCSELAFISLNTQQAARVEVHDESGVEAKDLDAAKPFALVLSSETTQVVFYDAAGNVAGDYAIAREQP